MNRVFVAGAAIETPPEFPDFTIIENPGFPFARAKATMLPSGLKRAAVSRPGRLVIPSCFQNRATFLGPRSGTWSSSTRPGGTSASRRSRKPSRPVVSSSSIFSAMALPTPGMVCSSPALKTSLISRPRASMLSAALR